MAFKLDNIPNSPAKKSAGSEIENLLKKEIVLFGSGFSNKKKQDICRTIK